MTPLKGLKVVEMARILAGPWAGQALADLGADVIKIEATQGDDTRKWGPPFIERDGDKTAAYFYGANRGKTSVAIDFSTPEGQAQVHDLVADADIFIENFKVGGLTKYDLDYASLAARNPRLIYCSITGFGQTGPMAHAPGYDLMIQGLSGLMSITGEASGQPQKVGVAVTDVVTGLYSTIGILAAVQQRHITGTGQHIDMALLDCATAMLANQNMNYLTTGSAPMRSGNAHPNLVPYQVVPTSDGHIIVAVGNDAQYQRFCDALGATELGQHPDYATNARRIANRDALTALIEPLTAQHTAATLLANLSKVQVPSGPINTIEQAFESDQIKARGLQINPEGVAGVKGPWVFSDADLALDKTAPKLPKN